MNIRQTCLIITSVLGLSFITIISFKLTDLYSTKIDSMEMQSSIEATAIMNKAIIELSLERSVMQVNLNLDEPIQPSFRNLIDQQRTISDQGFEDVKQLVDDYGTFRLGDTFIERLEQLETTIQGIRARADQNLSKPLDQRVRGEVSGLPSEMKDVILAFSHLPIKLSADGNQVSTALLSLKLVQENAWAVREFGGRERTHLAIATATGRPIAASIRAEMHADHKRAQEAMARLEVIAESGAINESIVDAIAELKTTYFSTYKATREDLIGASEQGSTLPISFERFFTVSSEALQSAVDLSYLAASEMEGYMNNRRSTSTAQFFFYAGILIAVIVLSAFQFYYIQLRVSRRILGLTDVMNRLSKGDTAIDLETFQSRDELGEMAECVKVFKDNAVEKQRLEAASIQMADQFEESVYGIVKRVEAESQKMHEMSVQLSGLISNSSNMSASVADASQTAAADVQTVAAAAEELTISISNISETVIDTANRTMACSQSANQSQQKLEDLQNAIEQIDSVTQAIIGISEQTNLLALNATIEAASAGESGKGFAVVANEVKSLSTETQRMTNEISQKINDIKSSASQTIRSVAEIINEISAVDERTNNLSSSIKEQNDTTSEISRSVASAAAQTGEVSTNITEVRSAADESVASTNELQVAAAGMIEESKTLKDSVEAFLSEIRKR